MLFVVPVEHHVRNRDNTKLLTLPLRKSRHSSFTIVTRPRDGRGFEVLVQAETQTSVSSQVKTCYGARKVSHLMCTEDSFQGEKGRNLKWLPACVYCRGEDRVMLYLHDPSSFVAWLLTEHRKKSGLYTFSSCQYERQLCVCWARELEGKYS